MDQGLIATAPVDGIPGSLEGQVFATAYGVFDAYCGLMESKYGVRRPVKQYQDYKPYWKSCLGIARLCLAEQWDVEDYVECALTMVRRNHRVTYPSDLLNANIVDRYRRELDEKLLTNDPLDYWGGLVATLLRLLQDTKVTEDAILYSPMMPFPDWFRVVYPEHPSERIMNIYGDDAWKELSRSRKLRAAVRRLAPGHLEALERVKGKFMEIPEVNR